MLTMETPSVKAPAVKMLAIKTPTIKVLNIKTPTAKKQP
jgi:hypothetical protein